MTDCLFCQIASGQLNTDYLHEDDQCVAFADINPQAPTHILIIPRQHIATLNELTEDNQSLVGHLTLTAKQIARAQGIAKDGYRLVWNCEQQGGQEVYHIHLHLLGGRQMRWPPG